MAETPKPIRGLMDLVDPTKPAPWATVQTVTSRPYSITDRLIPPLPGGAPPPEPGNG